MDKLDQPSERNNSDAEIVLHERGHPRQHEHTSHATHSYPIIDTELHEKGEKELGLRDYIDILIRRKRTVLIVAALVMMVACVYTFTRTNVYRSEAVIELEKESGSTLSNLGETITQGLVGGVEAEVFATQINILKSRALVEALIDKMNLTENPEFVSAGPGYLGAAISWVIKQIVGGNDGREEKGDPTKVRENLISNVTARISAKREGQSRLLKVGFEAKSPAFAKEGLTQLVDLYLQQNLHKRRRTQIEAVTWLNNEIKSAEEKVVKSLANLVEFTAKHGVVSVDDAANHILTFFQKSAESLVKTKELRLQVEALGKDQSANLAAGISGVKTPDLEQLYAKLSLLEAEYAQMSEVYSENYPRLVMMRKQIQFLKKRIDEEQKKAVKSVIDSAKEREAMSEEVFESAKKAAMDTKSLGVQFAVLKRDAETNEEIFRTLLKKAKELELSAEIIGNNMLTVVPPSIPITPVWPKKGLNMLIGAVLALALGVGAAFLKENLDTSIQDSRDLEKLRLLNLGMIPNYQHIKKLEKDDTQPEENKPPELVVASEPSSAIAEAFSLVRTSLMLTTNNGGPRVIAVTSAAPGEGKTFNAISIAATMANYGERVLLFEGDMRKPRVSKVFSIPRGAVGLSTLLSLPQANADQCIVETNIPNLYILPAGPPPKDPARLLDSDRMKDLLHELVEHYDLIIIDTPPVSGLPDTRIITKFADGVLFVVKQGQTSMDVIRSSLVALDRVKRGVILGAVFNNVGVSSGRYSYYGYRYGGYSHYYRYGYNAYYRAQNKGEHRDVT